MKSKSLKALRIFALIVGWIMAIASFVVTLLLVLIPKEELFELVMDNNMGEFINTLFTGIGNTFLAFLIAAVVRMIEKKAPIGKVIASRLMYSCCISYIAATIGEGYEIFLYCKALKIPLILSTLSFTPLIYTVAIFVFYNHFTKMVTFESEVA